MLRPDLKMIEPGRGCGAGSGEADVQCGKDGTDHKPQGATIAQRRADSICLAVAVPIFRASYSLEDLRQYHAEHGNLVREIAARAALVVLRLVWRVLP